MSSSRPQVPAVEPTYDPTRPFPNIRPLYQHPIPNCPGKTIVALHVTFPPNSATPPHTHPGAFVIVNLVSGYVLNKMNNDQMQIYGPGETFHENPGCRHWISDNASATEEATFVATFIVDTKAVEEGGVEGLVVIDEEYREMVKQKSFEKTDGEI
ncbi:hypothetical protein B7494_g7946 [Chlorociboria aeruginascens]|nr:hypothetical protein B7494_g7946 [Chlorociboria aeruginascens]